MTSARLSTMSILPSACLTRLRTSSRGEIHGVIALQTEDRIFCRFSGDAAGRDVCDAAVFERQAGVGDVHVLRQNPDPAASTCASGAGTNQARMSRSWIMGSRMTSTSVPRSKKGGGDAPRRTGAP